MTGSVEGEVQSESGLGDVICDASRHSRHSHMACHGLTPACLLFALCAEPASASLAQHGCTLAYDVMLPGHGPSVPVVAGGAGSLVCGTCLTCVARQRGP